MPLKAQTIGVNGQNISYTDDDNAIKKVDFIVALGGDGTILRIAKKAAIYNIPLIGVNVGHVGFMSELEKSEISRRIDEILKELR